MTPTEQLEAAMKKINDDLAADILQKAREMSPAKFEQLVLDLLLNMGYGGANKELAKVTPLSHDNGVDGIIPEDALGLDRIYIQAKRYKEGAPVHLMNRKLQREYLSQRAHSLRERVSR